MTLEKKIDINHIIVHGTFQLIAGITYGFGIYMLLERGFDSAQAGLCLSLGNVVSFFIQPAISNYLDNTKKISVIGMLKILTVLDLILFLVNYFLRSKSIAVAIVFILCVGLYSSCEPLVNSLSNLLVTNGIKADFGLARAIGSLSYGSSCALLGILSNRFSYITVLLFGFIFSLLFTIAIFVISKNFKKTGINIFENKTDKPIGYNEFFKRQKHFIFLCLFMAGIFFGYTCIDNFTLLVVENVGGNSKDMGIILAIKAAIEAIGIFAFSKLIKRFKVEQLLTVAAIGFVLKLYVTFIATDIIYIYLSQVIQGFSFGFLVPGIVEYVSQNMSDKEAIRGQAFFTMSIVVGSTFSSLIGGYIAENFSTNIMEAVALVSMIISAIGFIILLWNKHDKHMSI